MIEMIADRDVRLCDCASVRLPGTDDVPSGWVYWTAQYSLASVMMHSGSSFPRVWDVI